MIDSSITFTPHEYLLKHDQNCFLRTPEVALSYREVFAIVQNLAKELSAANIPAGSYLGAYGLSPLENVLLLLACLTHGSAFVPLNDREPAVTSCREASRHVPFAGLLLGSAQHADELAAVWKESLPLKLTTTDSAHRTENDKLSRHYYQGLQWSTPATLKPHELASVIFTSGSSGERKGVAHNFQSHYFSARGTNEFYGLTSTDSWLLSLPMFHIGGLMIPLRAMLCGSICHIPAHTAITLAALQQFQPAAISLVPTQLFRLMAECDQTQVPGSIKAILLGGARCPPALLAKARSRGLPISLTYGSSEASSQIVATRPDETSIDPALVGELLPYRVLRLENGRTLLGGKTLFQGYLRHHVLESAITPEGWFITSDVLEQDAHEKVYRFAGRLDDIMIISGENISPQAIEQQLAEDLPHDMVCKVVPRDDPEFGQRAVLMVFAKARPDGQWLRGVINRRLTTLKRPRQIFWCQGLDSSLYKLSTHECLALLTSHFAGDGRGPIEEI